MAVDARAVTVHFIALGGLQRTLQFEQSTTSLGEMQRQLCTMFGKSWPRTQVGLLVGGVAFDEFMQQPLLHLQRDGEQVTAVFSIARDLKYLDLCFRNKGRRTFEEDMADD